jgi:hypothetical protein
LHGTNKKICVSNVEAKKFNKNAQSEQKYTGCSVTKIYRFVSSIFVFCLVGKSKPRGLSSLAQRKSKMFPYGFNWTKSGHSFGLAAVHSDHIIIQNPNPNPKLLPHL